MSTSSPDPASPETESPVAATGQGTSPEPDAERAPGLRLRGHTLGPLLAMAAIATVAINLRPGATSIGPLMEVIVGAFGQGALASGLLTALPPVAFGALGLLAVPVARRLGMTGAIVATFILAAVGLLLRPAMPGFGLFVALSVLALLGPALGNVMVPAWIKLHGGTLGVRLMVMYTVLLAAGGSVGAALAVPLAGDGGADWQDSLRFWGMVVVLPVVVWAVALTRTGHDFPPAPPRGTVQGSLLRSPTAIALTFMFALQSLNAYTQFGMLPQLLTDAGVTPARAGLLTAVVAAWGLVGGLVMPGIIARAKGLPWLAAGMGALTASGYLGLLLLPAVSPLVWACVLGIGGFAFPTTLALLPARTRSPLVTARLSGMVQPLGYLLGAVGPITAGALLGATGDSRVVLAFLAGTGVLLAIAGFRAAQPRMVDDELTA